MERITRLQKKAKKYRDKYPHVALRLYERVARIQEICSSADPKETSTTYVDLCEIAMSLRRNVDAFYFAKRCVDLNHLNEKVRKLYHVD